MVSKRLARWAAAAALIAGSTFDIAAQQPASAFPVIVVLQGDAPLARYRASYRADARAAAYHNRDVVAAIQALEAQHGFRADRFYSAAIRGFSARLSAQQIANLVGDAIVASVEPDGEMTIVGQPQAKGKPGGGGEPAQVTPWGIARIGAAGKPAVSTVRAYVLDTGIDLAQPDLNVIQNVNFVGGPNTDCNGHGTHVAGTIAAVDNAIGVVGVAAGAPLVAVKVLGCGGSGSTSGVIAGIDWVTANAVQPAIANMSLGGGASAALDAAVIGSAATGVVYSLAASNDGADACNYSPARLGAATDGVITTAATASNDSEPSWSNYGSCVDIWAPGAGILSTKKGGGTTTMSGTSMASPHVGGTAARYLALWPGTSAADVELSMKANVISTTRTSKDGRPIVIVNAAVY